MKSRSTGDDGFDVFWAAYPRHDAKLPALKEWRKLKPDAGLLQTMLDSLAWQKETRQWQDGFVCHARTWLHQQRWTDEPFDPRGGGVPVKGNGHGKAEALLRTLGVRK